MQTQSLIRPTKHAGRISRRTEHVSACLPFIADLKNGTSYAPWQVWSGSTTKDARFVPIPKRAAIRIYHKAVDWNRSGKLAGRHGGSPNTSTNFNQNLGCRMSSPRFMPET